jgi:hypothetical protein
MIGKSRAPNTALRYLGRAIKHRKHVTRAYYRALRAVRHQPPQDRLRLITVYRAWLRKQRRARQARAA